MKIIIPFNCYNFFSYHSYLPLYMFDIYISDIYFDVKRDAIMFSST